MKRERLLAAYAAINGLRRRKYQMVKRCNKALKPNPFIAERDPRTGKWMAIKLNFEATRSSDAAILGC